jgi:hypothetical protein
VGGGLGNVAEIPLSSSGREITPNRCRRWSTPTQRYNNKHRSVTAPALAGPAPSLLPWLCGRRSLGLRPSSAARSSPHRAGLQPLPWVWCRRSLKLQRSVRLSAQSNRPTPVTTVTPAARGRLRTTSVMHSAALICGVPSGGSSPQGGMLHAVPPLYITERCASQAFGLSLGESTWRASSHLPPLRLRRRLRRTSPNNGTSAAPDGTTLVPWEAPPVAG